jgi:hypothetical protein
MSTLAYFPRLAFVCIACVSFASARAASPRAVEQRDGQVLQALLLHLLTDPKFDMARVPTNGAVIVLHTRTPEKTGFLQAHQMRSDIGDHKLPGDVERDLRSRNTPTDAKPDTYDAVAASFTNLTFGAGIVLADLTADGGGRRSYGWFSEAHPKARGWVRAYLPGYSTDGSRAVIRASVGPSAHGAMVTALLERAGDRWVVKWHHIAWYA